MSKQEKSRKPLIIGIIAAVVILAVLLVLLLTQCAPGGGSGTSDTDTPAQTVGAIGEAEEYDLYWNLDRALYDGKSEAGLSSRQPESDGYFHVRFFKDGEIIELRVMDRRTVNAIEINDLMGLVFDEDGIVIECISLDDMPVQQVGWKFYVQSTGGSLMKLNSSKKFDGMELLLEVLDITGIYDMTGAEGEVGKSIMPVGGDRVIAIANLAGELTHVYVYERNDFMLTFDGECEHCEETVTWKMWNKTSALPTEAGHYQLQNDITLTTQQSIAEDGKICLDLNGFAVDGAEGRRMYSLHNAGAELALMDTSEGQTGVMRGHGEYNGQGGIVWVRYGAFYMYSGTLDASDLTTTINGTAVQVPKDRYFYMYGGTILGGTSKYSYNEETKKYSNGLGGAIAVSGKFVMYDGLISGGEAVAAVSAWNTDGTPKTYQRGIGGNIYVASGGEFEMRDGTIKNGVAGHSGGNVYLDGTSTMLMEGGVISGGQTTGKGRNGGNVFVSTKATLTMNGGSIIYGTSRNCAGNLYINGTVNMNGGYIGSGRIRDWKTGELKPENNTANVFLVNGRMNMYGGTVAGSYTATDTAANDKKQTVIVLGGLATISGPADQQCSDLFLTNGGDNITVIVATLMDKAKIGVNATTGIFTNPTKEGNTDNFYSNIPGAEVHYVDGCVALGRWSCVCGSDKHFGECDGTQLFWAPVTGNAIPAATGNYFLASDITLKAQCAVEENGDVKVDLNGYTLTGPNNKRALTTFNAGAKLTVTDTSEAKTGTVKSRGTGNTQGNAVWVRYGSFTFYGGTLDGSGYVLNTSWDTGKDGVFGTKDDTNGARDGGTVSMGSNTTFNMYGGTIIGNKAEATVATKTITEGEGKDAVKTEITKALVSPNGASLSVAKNCVFNMYAGTIRDGETGNCGGNIYASSNAVLNLYGGTVSGGKAGPVYDTDGTTVKVKGWGGNIELTGSATLNISGATITGGVSGGNGGNIRLGKATATLNMTSGTVSDGESLLDQGGNMFLSGTANLTGGQITGGKAKNGGNIGINSSKDVTLKGVTVSGGTVPGNGGNIRMSTTNTTGSLVIAEGTVITGGSAKQGGNLAVETNNANKNDPVAVLKITGGTVENGSVTTYGGNIYVASGVTASVSGGTVTGGTASSNGGNIYMCKTAEVNITGGTISGGKAGPVYGADGTTVKTKGWGGNIDMVDSSALNISGGTITGGVSGGNGGNIRVGNNKATLTMTGGTVSDGESLLDQGGNLFLSGTVTLSGGTVENGKAKNGGNIGINSTKNVTLDGVTVAGGTATGNGGNIRVSNTSSDGKLIIAEGTVITGGSAKNGGNLSVEANNANKNNPVVTCQITGGTIEKGTAVYGGNIYAPASTVLDITGGKIADGMALHDSDAHGGNIYISGSQVTISKATVSGGQAGGTELNPDGTVNFGTNDDTKMGWGGNISMASGSLTITEAQILGGTAGRNGGSIHVSGGTLTTSGATISGGKSVCDQGGNIWMGANTVLSVTGGKIVDGSCNAGKNGGNIHCNAGVDVTLSGVTISGGKAGDNARKATANVNIGASESVILDSVNIAGYVNISSGSTVTLTGKPVITGAAEGDNNLTLNGNKLVLKDLEEGTNVGITDASAGLFTTETDKAYASYFTSDDAAKTVAYVDVDKKIGLGRFSCQCGEKEHTLGCGKEQLFWLPVTGSSIPATTGNYYLTKDIKLSSQYAPAEGSVVNLDLNGFGLTCDYRVVALNKADASLTVTDTSEAQTGRIWKDGSYKGQGGLIWTAASGTKLTLIKGTLDGSQYTNSHGSGGGAVYLAANTSFDMYGGKIMGTSTTAGTGGNVGIAADATMNLYGGEIIGGKAPSGGNIGVAGTLNMVGGTVGSGVATSNGGNIHLAAGAQAELSGGKVENGTAKSGGNLYAGDDTETMIGSTLTLSGVAISGGTATGNGGSVRVNAFSTMTMTAGSVTGGMTTGDHGGNVWTNGEIYLYGGEITGGIAAKGGGNVHANAGSTVELENITISGGRAGEGFDGGNLSIQNASGTATVLIGDGTSISSGKVADLLNHPAANVAIDAKANVTIGSATITGYVTISNSGSTVTLTGKPAIFGGTTNLTLNGQKLNVDALDVGEDVNRIGITDTTAGIFTGTATLGDESYFFSDDNTKVVGFQNGKLTLEEGRIGLGRYSCICGMPDGTCLGAAGGCDGENHFWVAWTSKTTLPTEHGYWYLTEDVDISTQASLKEGANVVLDLNGKTVTATGKNRIYALYNLGSSLTITDTTADSENSGGKMIQSQTYSSQGAIVWVRWNAVDENYPPIFTDPGAHHGTFTLVAGELVGNPAANKTACSAVDVDMYGQFHMYGGKITGGATTGNGGNVTVDADAEMYLYGGEITGGQAKNGGNIYVAGRLVMTGGTVSGGKALYNGSDTALGGNICVTGTAQISAGTVTDGKAGFLGEDGVTVEFGTNDDTKKGWGGNIEVRNSGTLELSGTAVIEKGISGGNGGNIRINGADASMIMSGGTVSEGETKADNGGNIFNSGTLTVSGGKILDGEALKGGGNICMNSDKPITLTGVEISGGICGGNNAGNVQIFNKATTVTIGAGTVITGGVKKDGTNEDGTPKFTTIAGSNLNVVKASTVVLEGCQIDGYVNIIAGSTISVSGKTVITGGTTNLTLNGNKLDVSALAGDASIGITETKATVGVFTGKADAKLLSCFTSDDASKTVGLSYTAASNGTDIAKTGTYLALGKNMCVCGKTTADGEHALGCDKDVTLFWQPWSGNSMPNAEGNYYLTGNPTFSTYYAFEKGATVRIDLNGKTVTDTSARALSTSKNNKSGNVTLWITDTSAEKKGTIKLDYTTAYNGQGAVLWLDTASTLNLLAGTLDASSASNTHASGGVGVCVAASSTFNMYGGKILGAASAKSGAAVSLSSGSINLYGGEIVGGKAEKGGAIYATGGTVNISGTATVTGAASTNGGAIYSEGTVNISGTATVTGAASTLGGAIYTTGSLSISGGTVTGATAEAGGAVYIDTDATATVSGTASISGGKATTNGGNFYVLGSLEITGGTISGGVTTVKNSITAGNGANIASFGPVTMSGGEVKDGNAARSGANVWLRDSGSLTLSGDAEISGGYSADNGGSIRAEGGSTEVTISEEAQVLNGESGNTGGNIHVTGTLTISGGTVSGGKGKNASADHETADIYVVGGDMTMTGGTVAGNMTIINWNQLSGATLTLSGDAYIGRIMLNKGEDKADMDVADIEIPTITINGELTATTPMLVDTWKDVDCVISGTTVEANADNFEPANAYQSITWINDESDADYGKLYLGKYSCLCGKTTSKGEHALGCDKQVVRWTAWTDNDSLPVETGYWYLTKTVTLGGPGKITKENQNVVIDLNGQTVQNDSTKNVRLYWINAAGSSMTLTDTRTGGQFVNTATYTQGGGVWVNNGNTFNMVGGILNMSAYTCTYANGGSAVGVEGGATFNLYGGSIIGGYSESNGGSIYIEGAKVTDGVTEYGKSTMNMYGGQVSGGRAYSNGGNINCLGDLNISGGEVTGGRAGKYDANGDLELKANSTEYVRKGWGGNIEVAGSGKLSISAEAIVSNGVAGGNGGNIRVSSATATLEMSGGTVTGGTSLTDQGGNIFLQSSATFTGGTVEDGVAKNGGNIAANAKGQTISLSNVKIKDGRAGTVTVTNGEETYTASGAGGNIRLNTSACTLNIGAGTEITGGQAGTVASQNVNLNVNGCTVNITGGTIGGYVDLSRTGTIVSISGAPVIDGGTDCTSNLKLGAIDLTVGNLTEGADIHISANTGVFATAGEGVTLTYAHKDFFTADSGQVAFTANGLELLSDDTHVHCTCAGTLGTSANGYVYTHQLEADNTYTHTCLDIVYTKASEFTSLTTATGTIKPTGNMAIYLDASLTMANQLWSAGYSFDLCLNGNILTGSNNKRMLGTQDGGSITVTTCDVNYVDGSTTANALKPVGNDNQQGGGALWASAGTITLYRGTVDASGNTGSQSAHGMAVRVDATTFYQHAGSTIIGGHATKNSGDTAYAHGGAVYLGNDNSKYYMLGGTIKNGRAQWAGNVYIQKGVFTMYDGLITGGKYEPADATTADPDFKYTNVGLRTGTLDVRGGTINGRIGNCNTDVGTVKLSGSAKIYAEANPESSKNLTVTSQNISVGDLTDNALIYLTDVTGGTTLTVTGSNLTQEQVASQIIAPGYTATLSADGKTITFTAK